MTDYSTKFREEFKNAKPEQLLEMLIISNRHCYERAEIIKDAYNVMAAQSRALAPFDRLAEEALQTSPESKTILYAFNKAEITMKDLRNVLSLEELEPSPYEVTARMEKVLDGFMIDKPY